MKKNSVVCIILAILFVFLYACSKETSEVEEGSPMEDFEGNWQGAIQVPNQPLAISVAFDGQEGAISIPVQGIADFPLTAIEYDRPSIHFKMNIQNQQLSFDGEFIQGAITGTFTQQGQSFPFELARSTQSMEQDAGVKVQLDVAGGTMKALVVTPEGEGPFPAMLILSGSGPTDKNGNSPQLSGNNNSLKMVAEELAEQGIATIRYDKRGVGENAHLAGKEEDLQFDDYIADAAAWIAYAKSQEAFTTTGVIGHSEGSLIGMIAAQQQDASSFVSLAGPGRAIDEVLLEQLSKQLPQNLIAESRDIITKLKSGQTVEQIDPQLASMFRPSVQPYLISWLAYDPKLEFAKLDIPVLVVGGTTDLQVPAEDAQLLKSANEQAETLIIENMNHVLKHASADPAENIAAYNNPNLPLADGLIKGITEFLK